MFPKLKSPFVTYSFSVSPFIYLPLIHTHSHTHTHTQTCVPTCTQELFTLGRLEVAILNCIFVLLEVVLGIINSPRQLAIIEEEFFKFLKRWDIITHLLLF